jgi:hypothetical protein
MRRWVSLLSFVVSFAVCGEVALARDQSWWGWLDELSGPGPFRGSSVELLKLCQDRGASINSGRGIRGIANWSLGTPNNTTNCVWADQRFLHVGADQDFPAIAANLYDQGLSITWRRLVSVGVGIGLIRFNSDGPTGHVTTNRVTLTPLRLTANPLNLLSFKNPAAFSDRERIWSNILSVPQVYYKLVCIPGALNGASFGAPTSTFASSGECLESYGIQLNLLELMR